MDQELEVLLAYESLASYLRGLDDSDDAFTLPLAPLESTSVSVSPAPEPLALSTKDLRLKSRELEAGSKSVVRSAKARHSGRLRKLRNDIDVLYRQLNLLQRDPALRSNSNVRMSWKRRAVSERLARDRAEYENGYLKHCLVESAKLRTELKRLLFKQQQLLPRKLTKVEYSLVDSDTRTFGLLKADLLKRQCQLEASINSRLKEIAQQNLLGQFRQGGGPWDIVVHGNTLRVDIEESVLLPFDTALINAAICEYTQAGTIPVVEDKIVDRVIWGAMANDVELNFAIDGFPGERGMKGRSILRRIRNDHGMLLLWESMSYWQGADVRPHVILRESGWSIVAPAGEDLLDLSVGYCGESFRMQASDGSTMDKSDPVVGKIMNTHEKSRQIHSRRLENIVMDRDIELQKERALLKGDCQAEDLSSPTKRPKIRKAQVANEGKTVVTRNTKAEHDGRVEALNEEIRALYQEAQRLHQLDPAAPPGASAKWKRRAAAERLARTRAEYENESLRQRIAQGVAFQEQVKELLLRQLALHSSRFTGVEHSLVDNDARAFGVLKEELLKQQFQVESCMQSRLDDITRRSLLPCHAQVKNIWGVAVTSQEMCMRMEELDVLQFNADMMNAAIVQYTQDGSIPVDGDKVVEKVIRDVTTNHEFLRAALNRVSGARELECRYLSRRIQSEHGTILPIVHESGRSVTFASEQDPENISITYCSKAFRIESLNGPRMKRNDPLSRKIVHTYREFHNLHAGSIESIAIDTSLQQS